MLDSTEVVDRYRADILSGGSFDRSAAGYRSYIGYRPVTERRKVSALVTDLGRFAGSSDEAAQIVIAVLRALHVYGCEEEMRARACEAAAVAVREGYTDVVTRSSPNPGRPSDTQRPYSLRVLLDLRAIITRRTGWIDATLRAELGMPAGCPYLS